MSTSKKDAQTNAARDLSQHLIREGLIAPADIPELYVRVNDSVLCSTFGLLSHCKEQTIFRGIRKRFARLFIRRVGKPLFGLQILDWKRQL